MIDEIKKLEQKVIRRRAQRDSVQDQAEKVQTELSQLRTDVEDLEKIHGVITAYAKTYQEDFLKQIENVVSHGLTSIFEESMEFKIHQSVVGKRLEVKFSLITYQHDKPLETSIMDSRGGGIGAVVGFLLRVAILMLMPNARRLLVLDETFAQLSVEYLPALSEFIAQLCEQTGIQVLLVTHSTEFASEADVVYRVSHTENKTKVTRNV